MATSSSYVWNYYLADFPLTTGISNDHVAKVSTNKTMTVQNLADEVASERTDLRAETLVMAMDLMEQKAQELICQGYSVLTNNVLFKPTITGTFIGTSGTFDSDTNECVCNVSTTQSLRNAIADVTPSFTGLIKESGGARISLVTDATTKATDGTITSGGVLTVTGTKIKCLNEDGSDIGTISFINEETGETAGTVTVLVTNDPSKLIFTCPQLEAGNYILKIETYYTNSTTLLKTVREIESSTLTVLSESEETEDTTNSTAE